MHTSRANRATGERVMWLTSQRVFYAGLLGATRTRSLGGHAVYVSPRGLPNRVSIDGGPWQSGELLVVPPHVPHRVESPEPQVLNVVVEAESVRAEALPPVLQQSGAVHDDAMVRRVRVAHAQLLAACEGEAPPPADFDRLFFGEALAPRCVDPRIAQVIARICANPAEALAAEACAESVGLSFSRFLHLFRDQVGVPFRVFRAWKRARSLLRYVHQGTSLTDIALEAGYPDSTHFSHSIRQVYGLTPSDIVAGSRRLAVMDAHGPAAA